MRDRGLQGGESDGIMCDLVVIVVVDDREKAHRKPNQLFAFVSAARVFYCPFACAILYTSPDDLFHVSFQILGGEEEEGYQTEGKKK